MALFPRTVAFTRQQAGPFIPRETFPMIQRTAAVIAALIVAACTSSGPDNPGEPNVLPTYIKSTIFVITYDGVADDLLTAGLGKSGLAGAAPAVAVPTSPTTAELRRLAIYNNYRALV